MCVRIYKNSWVFVHVCLTWLWSALSGPRRQLILKVETTSHLSRICLSHHIVYIGQRHSLTLLSKK